MSTESTDVKSSMQAFKEASLAFVGMDWVGKGSQDEQTNAAAQEAFAKVSQVAKGLLAHAKNPVRESEEDVAAPQTADDNGVPAQDVAAQEYTEESQTSDVVVSGGMAASHLALEDEQAVCWDMAEQLEDDLEGANEEICTQLRNAINLLKSAKTPTEIEHAKRIAKAAKAAAENNGSEAGDDEPTLNDKINMLNRMYEAAKKSNEAAQHYIEEMDDIRKENPGLFSKEGWDAYDAWKEKAGKRQEEQEARQKAQDEEMKVAKTDEERTAIIIKYGKLQQEADERARKEDEEYRKQREEEEKRIAKSGTEKDKLDMQKVLDEYKKYEVASQDRNDLSPKIAEMLVKNRAGLAELKADPDPTQTKKQASSILEQAAHFLESQANTLEFTADGKDTKKVETGAPSMKAKANVARNPFASDDLLGELGAPTEKETTDVAVAKTKANTPKTGDVGEDVLGELAAPLGNRPTKDTKTHTRIV